MSSMVPMTPGLISGAPTLRGIRIDEADDLDAELVRGARRARARASTAAALVPTSSSRSRGPHAAAQPLERQPPADRQRR